MYFNYDSSDAGEWIANPDLKPERSLTQNLTLQGNGNLGYFTVNLHHTNYKDFLYEQQTVKTFVRPLLYPGAEPFKPEWKPVQQMQNIDSAKIYGIEFTGKLNLNEITPISNGCKLFG